uniref:GATA zinc finger domain-containing protein 1 n=1 Tax=Ictidomys tridecemlineatus TaxID=43179 RepID=UPI001A9EC79B|nr:GATA zinc finger domain-containing protein 1 [Ictidomys tridecemlineatus]
MARQEGEGEQELVLLLLRKSDSLKLVLVYSAQAVAEWKKYKEQRDTLPSLMVSQRGCVQKGAPKVSKLKGDGVAVAPAMHGERPYGQGDLYLPIKKQNAVKAYLFETSPQSKQEIHRRSARLRNTKYKSAPAAEKKVSTKGKGRRHIFKLKNPIKAPESVSTIITAESIFHKGVYYQIGDVVSVIDEQDGKPYYAQIRGFIQDQYCEKSAALTWLIPTLSSPRDQFDPASYIIGKGYTVSWETISNRDLRSNHRLQCRYHLHWSTQKTCAAWAVIKVIGRPLNAYPSLSHLPWTPNSMLWKVCCVCFKCKSVK